MEYTLLRPIKVSSRKKDGPFKGAFEIDIPYHHKIVEHGIEIRKPINTFYKSTPQGSHQAQIKTLPLTNEVAETYLKFQSIIGHCIINIPFTISKWKK